MRHSTADQRTRHFRDLASVCLRSSTPPARARREEYHLCPPPPSPQARSGTPADACNPSCCVAASITSTASTGELLHRYTTVHEPGGLLPVACKTRRASRCPPCAEIYRADTYQLIRAGLTGGKGVPARSPTTRACSSPSPHPRSARSMPGANGMSRVLACRPRRNGRDLPTRHPPVLQREARPRR